MKTILKIQIADGVKIEFMTDLHHILNLPFWNTVLKNLHAWAFIIGLAGASPAENIVFLSLNLHGILQSCVCIFSLSGVYWKAQKIRLGNRPDSTLSLSLNNKPISLSCLQNWCSLFFIISVMIQFEIQVVIMIVLISNPGRKAVLIPINRPVASSPGAGLLQS